MPYLIDEPEPFAPTQVWRVHLRRLREIPEQDAPEVKEAIARTQERIEEIRLLLSALGLAKRSRPS